MQLSVCLLVTVKGKGKVMFYGISYSKVINITGGDLQ